MPSDFNFSLEDLLADDDDAILREMHRYQQEPLKTTRSIAGDPGRLSVLSMGEILMGKPIYNDQENVLSMQELAMTHLLAGGIADLKGKDKNELNINGFQSELIIPEDILYYAKEFRKKFRKTTTTSGGSSGGGDAYDGVPEDVANSEAFKNTNPSGPSVAKWVNLMLSQQGDPYNNTGQEVRGITDDPNPGSFDCSGLMWWATNQCIPGTDFAKVSGPQWQYCLDRGTVLDNVDMAYRTRGALIWPNDDGGHIGCSLGDGTVIESSQGGVRRNDWGFQGGQWAWAKGALHPLMSYSKITAAAGGGANFPVNATTVTGAQNDTFGGQGGPPEARIRWAAVFLHALVGTVTGNNLVSVVAWQYGENTNAQFNPLATTQTWPGSTPFNSNSGYPVQNFATPDDGFNATIQTITNGHYPNVLADLQADASPESTMGHFDGGPSGGNDLNIWGTGSLPYQNLGRARDDIGARLQLVSDLFTFFNGTETTFEDIPIVM